MTILVSAIEVGSVRALVPICNYLADDVPIVIDNNGFFQEDEVGELEEYLINIPIEDDGLENFIKDQSIRLVLFSVNIHSTRPLQIARMADSLKIPTVHVLDYANNYKYRMELDGKELFEPTRYLVPDEYSRKGAIEESIPQRLIKVVGQPAFADLNIKFAINSELENPFKGIIDNIKGVKIILFVSEPVGDDQGSSLEDSPHYRGYTEYNVIDILINSLQNINQKLWFIVLPHPRQDTKKLRETWELLGGNKYGAVYEGRGEAFLPFVHGVAGMASTLLYEAWLLGKRVLSLQPGLINNSLRMLSEKGGVTFIDQYKIAEDVVANWL